MSKTAQHDPLYVVRLFAKHVIRGSLTFAEVSDKCKPYVAKCLEVNGYADLVPDEFKTKKGKR